MNIEGLGPAIIDQLVERKLVRSVPDLYRLNVSQLSELPHMGTKSATKLVDEISASKERGLACLLTGLGIRHVGDRNARLLANHFSTIDAIMKASHEQLAAIPGVGSVVAKSVHEFFHSELGRRMIEELREAGVKMAEVRTRLSGRLAGRLQGKTIVVTGTLAHFDRHEVQALIDRLGGHSSSSVSKNTDYVVVGDQPGSKLAKARKLGIRTLSEKEFMKIVGVKSSVFSFGG
jgi:DNA ligase (NAD+)